MNDPVKPWVNRIVEFAFAVLVAALMLSCAWALLRPLVPVIGTFVLLLAGLWWLTTAGVRAEAGRTEEQIQQARRQLFDITLRSYRTMLDEARRAQQRGRRGYPNQASNQDHRY